MVPADSGGSDAEDKPDDASMDFRNYVASLYLRNRHSAAATQVLAEKATKAGASGVEDLAGAGASGRHPKNAQRDIMRKLLKHSNCPPVYWAKVPVKNTGPGTGKIYDWIPFLLIFEVMAMILGKPGCSLASFATLPPTLPGLRDKKNRWCAKMKLDPEVTVPLGVHGDGVPHQSNGSTIECFSWNFVSMPEAERFPFTCIEKDSLCNCGCSGRCTTNAIMDVLVWCMRQLLVGTLPTCRHDGTPWLPSDRSRVKGRRLDFYAGVLQIRGDWANLKQWFGFKGWAGREICWRCLSNKSDIPYTDFGLKAQWRKVRMTLPMLVATLRKSGVTPCALFALPGFDLAFIVIDVLHTLDLGVSQDFLGNLFFEAISSHAYLDGANREARH